MFRKPAISATDILSESDQNEERHSSICSRSSIDESPYDHPYATNRSYYSKNNNNNNNNNSNSNNNDNYNKQTSVIGTGSLKRESRIPLLGTSGKSASLDSRKISKESLCHPQCGGDLIVVSFPSI